MKYKELIEKLTVEEKAGLLSGQNFWNTKAVARLGIPSIMLTDGPHGLRKQGGKADHLGLNESIPATCFPTAATLANSWDVTLAQEVGICLGKEAAAQDVGVLLGPGLNIKRSPLCGRNFEYFSEDPVLSGKLAAAIINGIQQSGVSACPKHFAVNSQELNRMAINEVVDERTLREIYLEGFRYAVSEGKPKTIMTSYNQVNGSYANENQHLLQDILCGEWGYDGVVVTDWGGEVDRVAGLKAGNQLEMPSSGGMTDREIVEAVRAGTVSQDLLDESVDRLLTLVFDTKQNTVKEDVLPQHHHAIARRVAANSAVLLKNENDILPLPPKSSVAVIGDFAKTPRYQGAGSSLINPTQIDSALDALQQEDLQIVGYASGFHRYGKKSASKEAKAIALAKKADVILLFLGLDESSEAEGVDREHMRLPENQITLLHKLSALNKKIVIVLSGGSPIEMPWENEAAAILHLYLGGQASGGAAADVLMGRVNPSGKLAETYPLCGQDAPSAPWFHNGERSSEHREGLFVGYRYYDTVQKNVQWPFGYGLSYTTFAYSDLAITDHTVRFVLTNTGTMAGAEIAQLYIEKKNSVLFRAKKELKGFAKIFLQPAQSREVCITLDEHAFAYYNVECEDWVVEAGEYSVQIGASSRDIQLSKTVVQKGTVSKNPYEGKQLPAYFRGEVHDVTEQEFECLYGQPLPEKLWDRKAPLGYHDILAQGKYKKGLGKFLYHLICLARKACFAFGKPIAGNNVMFAMNLPFLRLARFSGGKIDLPMLDGILVMVNGQFWKGLKITLTAQSEKKKREKANHRKP